MAWHFEANQHLQKSDLLERVPEVQTIAQVEESSFRRPSSRALLALVLTRTSEPR